MDVITEFIENEPNQWKNHVVKSLIIYNQWTHFMQWKFHELQYAIFKHAPCMRLWWADSLVGNTQYQSEDYQIEPRIEHC